MKPWKTWLARLGIAGACFLVTGCGGGDVPDASSDGQAATDRNAGGEVAAAAPAVAATEEPKVAQADSSQKADEAPGESPAATPAPEPETPAASPKPQQGQGSTAEMLALATGPAGSATPPAGGAAPPADASTPPAPGSPGAPGATAPGGAMAPGGPGGPGGPGRMPGGGMGPGGPGAGGRPPMGPGAGAPPMGGEQMARMAAGGMMGRPGAPGPPGGRDEGNLGLGGAGRPGGAQPDAGPANLHTPEGAVTAFLNALKAKDLDRLNESTALRAQNEASAKNQELFRKIFDLSLSDSELDDLAHKLEGYTIAGENPARSTARVEVILRKADENGGYFLRKVTVRHEKKGWGVLDVAGAQEFKSLNARPKRKR